MRKTVEIKDVFSQSLRTCLRKHYGKVPAASVIAKDFNLRAYSIDPITQESARRWIRGVSIPEEDRLKVLIEWLGLDFNAILTSNNVTANIQSGNGLTNSQDSYKASSENSNSNDDLMRLFYTLTEEKQKLILNLVQVITHSS